MAITTGVIWNIVLPYYGSIWQEMSSNSAVNTSTAHQIYMVVMFLAMFFSTFVASESRIKTMAITGLSVCYALSYMIWFFPAIQAYYVVYVVLGIFTGMFYGAFFYMFIYGFLLDLKIKAGTLYALITGLAMYGFNQLYVSISHDFFFIVVTMLLPVSVLCVHLYNTDELINPQDIQERKSPIKLLATISMVIFTAYLNSGIIVNGLHGELAGGAEAASALIGVIICVVYFKQTNNNYFSALYFALIFIALTYAFSLMDIRVFPVSLLSYNICSWFFEIFTFSFIPYLGLKYGRNFSVLRIGIFAVGLGATLGDIAGTAIYQAAGENKTIVTAVILSVFLAGMMIIPLLPKYLYPETAENESAKEKPNNGINLVVGGENTVKEIREVKERTDNSFNIPDMATLLTEIVFEEGRLTAREQEILSYLVLRYDYDTIAKKLYISKNTLKVHAKHIYQKLHVSGRKELIELMNKESVHI